MEVSSNCEANPLSALKNLIQAQHPWDEIKQQLLRISQSDLEKEDENRFNILHHAIQANYAEVVHHLLMRGYFMELQQPSQIPYLHLACIYGHASIVNILMQERPNDFPPGLPENVKTDLVPKPSPTEVSQYDLTTLRDFSPLDLAAASKEIRCVQLLLSDEHQYGSMLERAVKHGSTECVKFILTEDRDNISQDELNKAFKLALIRKLAGCLELLLQEGIEVDLVLNTMNPYHVMYMYSSGFQLHPIRNEGLAECTQILINHGIDVNSSYPGGSYPLYSLIHSMIEEKDFDPSTVPSSHIKALEYLLEAGADPNFDEENLPGNKYDPDMDFFFSFSLGRDTCTSALNALFVAIEQSDNWNEHSPDFYLGCLELILDHGGDAKALNRHGNYPLHDLMKAMAVQHAQGKYIDILGPVSVLVKYGANLNANNSECALPMVPLTLYIMELLKSFSFGNCNPCYFTKWCASPLSGDISKLILYMEPKTAYEAYDTIMRFVNAHPHPDIAESSLQSISPIFAQYVFEPRRLSSICTASIWSSIQYDLKKIDQIPVPKMVKNMLYNRFNL